MTLFWQDLTASWPPNPLERALIQRLLHFCTGQILSAGNHIIATTLGWTADADENRAFNKLRSQPQRPIESGSYHRHIHKEIVLMLVGGEGGGEPMLHTYLCIYQKGWWTLIIHDEVYIQM